MDWYQIMKYWERMKFVSSHFQCSVTRRLFVPRVPAYASPSLQNSKNFRSVSSSNFRTQGSFVRTKQKKTIFERAFFRQTASHNLRHINLWVFETEPIKAANILLWRNFHNPDKCNLNYACRMIIFWKLLFTDLMC